MPGVLLKIVGPAHDNESEMRDVYVVDYDPKIGETFTEGGWRRLETTKDPAKAKVFADIREALECWREPHGLRPDGFPNRPLTAFTVTFEPAPEKKE